LLKVQLRRGCPAGIRLNDVEAVKTYKIDKEMTALGFEAARALQRDASGWPVLGSRHDFDA